MLALGRWGFRSMGEPRDDDVVTADSLTMALRTAFTGKRGSPALDFEIRVGPVALRARAKGDELSVVQIAPPAPPVGGSLPEGEPELRFTTDPGIRHLIAGTVGAREAVDQGAVVIEQGDSEMLERFAELFRIELVVA